jgi:phospholipid/cholesterol/gamma-HCH transport system permease protein
MDQMIDITAEAIQPEGSVLLRLSGVLTARTITSARADILSHSPREKLALDIGQVSRLDTAGGWLLCDLEARFRQGGVTVEIANAPEEARQIIETVRNAWPERPAAAPATPAWLTFLETTGRNTHKGARFLLGLLGYLGLFFHRLFRVISHPRQFRLTALVAHCEDVGLRAVPIVALMAFLIGVVLAFQGSAQLQQFGAEVFVVDLIAISILRELGILLTAIIVAGRTASAFTAAIGSMKMREEIDAMRTLGLDPATILFLPRILALLLMLPILGLIANLMGLLGGALMAWIDLGISPSMFQARLLAGTDVSHVFVGMIKAPVFALIIGVVGCFAGMQVEGNAESLGRMTSNAVVTAIFAVIVADALFSIFFAQVGI